MVRHQGGHQDDHAALDGTTWRHVPSPSPGHQVQGSGTLGNELTGVAILSRSNAWSAGDYSVRKAGQAALIQHSKGTGWARAPNPDQNGATHTLLNGISMASATDGWAVGGHVNNNQAVILHWNGTTWSRP